jgi:hypothetical protein
MQPFHGSARDDEEEQRKSLCGDYSQDSQVYGNSGNPQSKAARVRRRSAIKFGTPLAAPSTYWAFMSDRPATGAPDVRSPLLFFSQLFLSQVRSVRQLRKLGARDRRAGISTHQDDQGSNYIGHCSLFCLLEPGYDGFISRYLAKVVFRGFSGLVNRLYSLQCSNYRRGDPDKPACSKRSNGL